MQSPEPSLPWDHPDKTSEMILDDMRRALNVPLTDFQQAIIEDVQRKHAREADRGIREASVHFNAKGREGERIKGAYIDEIRTVQPISGATLQWQDAEGNWHDVGSATEVTFEPTEEDEAFRSDKYPTSWSVSHIFDMRTKSQRKAYKILTGLSEAEVRAQQLSVELAKPTQKVYPTSGGRFEKRGRRK